MHRRSDDRYQGHRALAMRLIAGRPALSDVLAPVLLMSCRPFRQLPGVSSRAHRPAWHVVQPSLHSHHCNCQPPLSLDMDS